MLAKRPADEAVAQKLICYATMVILLVYFMKFVRNMRKQRPCEEHPPPVARCTGVYAHVRKASPHHTSKIGPHDDAGTNDGHKQRKRRNRYSTEQWTARSKPSYSTDSFDDPSDIWWYINKHQKELKNLWKIKSFIMNNVQADVFLSMCEL